MSRTMPIPDLSHGVAADALPLAAPADLDHAVAVSWNRIRYYHVGRRHAYVLPPLNDNPPRFAASTHRPGRD